MLATEDQHGKFSKLNLMACGGIRMPISMVISLKINIKAQQECLCLGLRQEG